MSLAKSTQREPWWVGVLCLGSFAHPMPLTAHPHPQVQGCERRAERPLEGALLLFCSSLRPRTFIPGSYFNLSLLLPHLTSRLRLVLTFSLF